jgi:hypothetical protein
MYTRVRTEKQIEKDNAAYAAMAPLERRVRIAKEVLQMMKANLFVPSWGYGHVQIKKDSYRDEGSLQSQMIRGEIWCEGCVKAATLFAKAMLVDGLSGYDLREGMTQEVSQEVFGHRCADLMEALYERWDIQMELPWLSREQLKAVKEFDEVTTALRGERMKLLYSNIVKNGGHLVIGPYKF